MAVGAAGPRPQGQVAPDGSPLPGLATGAGTPGANPIPLASVYQGAENAARLAWTNANAQYNAALNQNRIAYGFNAKGNALSGKNPFGAFQQLNRASGQAAEQLAQAQSDAGLSGGMAGQQNAQAKFGHDLQSSQLAQGYQSTALGDLQGKRDALVQYGQALIGAEDTSLQYALAHNIHTPAQLSAVRAYLNRQGGSAYRLAQKQSGLYPKLGTP